MGILLPLGLGLAISFEQEQRKAWRQFSEALQKRDSLVPNLIYLIKTHPGYPDLDGAATLFRAHKSCETLDSSNTLNHLSVCVVELRRLIEGQQSVLGPRLAKSNKLAHWQTLSTEFERASAALRSSCAQLSSRWQNRPALARPFAWILTKHDWRAFQVCEKEKGYPVPFGSSARQKAD